MTFPRCVLFSGISLIASTASARAIDEIQVYNAEIAKVGQWTFQLHSNYAFIGRARSRTFPGGLIPNHALQGTGEWASCPGTTTTTGRPGKQFAGRTNVRRS
jgi:hypothetical protein